MCVCVLLCTVYNVSLYSWHYAGLIGLLPTSTTSYLQELQLNCILPITNPHQCIYVASLRHGYALEVTPSTWKVTLILFSNCFQQGDSTVKQLCKPRTPQMVSYRSSMNLYNDNEVMQLEIGMRKCTRF